MDTIKTNCFAEKNGGCVALSEVVCRKKGECPFFKTMPQYIHDYMKVFGTEGLVPMLENFDDEKIRTAIKGERNA